MKKRILFASNNQNKIREIKEIIKDYEVLSLKDAGIDIDIIEDGNTFEENAFIKAETIAKLIKGMPELKETIVLADDSGIEIDYLNGAPGIYSARWLPNKNDSEVNEEVIKKLAGVKFEDRKAHYTTVIACVLPDGKKIFTKGFTYGFITEEQKGTEGFAYDTIFYVSDFKCTMAEMTLEQKNSISHRGNAIREMQKKIDLERITYLRKTVIEHDLRYARNVQTVTDTDYDNLYMELVDLEFKYPEYYDKDSPTQRIYDIKIDGLENVKHTTPMLSQDKINDRNGLIAFLKKIIGDIIIEQKLDGLTIVLKYNNGLLDDAVSRGNGYIGKRCKHIALNTTNIPKAIPFKGKLELRGEAIIPIADFDRVNVNGDYASARNLASGTCISLEGKVAKDRGLKFISYDLVEAEGLDFANDTEQMEFLKKQGFELVENAVFKGDDPERDNKIIGYVEKYNKDIRPKLPHKIDGLVIKANNLEIREELGYTNKFPRWATAYKFESLDAITRIIDIEWSIGKNGQATPTAILEPVEIDGVTITRASLANYDDILRRGIKLYDYVIVERRNDVIPKVIAPIRDKRTGEEQEIVLIKVCPTCGHKLQKEILKDGNESVHYFCVNSECFAQLERKLKSFCSKEGLDINGLGEKTVEQLFSKSIIKTYIDIFHLSERVAEMKNLDKMGDKKIEKLLKGVTESKISPLSNILYALSIRQIGDGTANKIAKHFNNMDNLLNAFEKGTDFFYSELISIQDVGEEASKSVINFFSIDENIELIKDLKNEGLSMVEEVSEIINSPFTGKAVVATGSLEKYGRTEIKDKLESLGAKVVGSVSKKTDFVIYGTGAGSKYTKAIELGIKTLTEREFLDMIGE